MILRPLLFLHRWLGIVIGALMTMWCLSGFVMMYSPYPRLSPDEQLRGLATLQSGAGWRWDDIALPGDMLLASARVEMSGARPVLRVTPALDPSRPIAQMRAMPLGFDLASGRALAPTSQARALVVAATFGRRYGIGGAPLAASPVTIDQWTVQTARRNQPLWRVDYAGGDSAYVAGSGEVVQHTTCAERFWGWLGAVPHWLYPTVLRQNGALWSQVVIWTSLAGCFLTITGMWVGIIRIKRNRAGQLASPYRGIWWWHHMAGLFFGVLTLTWVASGLFSMNPFGFLDSDAGLTARERLAGPLPWAATKRALAALQTPPLGTVRIEAAPLGARTYLVAISADGRRVRYDADGRSSPLRQSELANALKNGPPMASLELMHGEDAYYYGSKTPALLPVWRAILADGQATRLYIDPETGRLLRAFDVNARADRWLMSGLHSFDWPVLRARPLWDLVVLPLLAMVTLVCGTGTWLGIQKLRRDARRIRNHRRRLARRMAPNRVLAT